MKKVIASRNIADSHIGSVSQSRHTLFRGYALIEMACFGRKEITCETVPSTSDGLYIYGNHMRFVGLGIFYASCRRDRKPPAGFPEAFTQQQDCVFAKLLKHFPLKHAHRNSSKISEQKPENFARVLSMNQFSGYNHCQPPALPKKRCRVHDKRRPRRAQLRKFHTRVKRTSKSVCPLCAIEGLISNEGRIPHNRGR